MMQSNILILNVALIQNNLLKLCVSDFAIITKHYMDKETLSSIKIYDAQWRWGNHCLSGKDMVYQMLLQNPLFMISVWMSLLTDLARP